MKHAEKLLKGLIILNEYDGNEIAAEHDILFAGPTPAEIVNDYDTQKLEEYGWFIDGGAESWAFWV